jgi:collagen type XIV alpha
MDVVIILDVSSSNIQTFNTYLQAARELVYNMPIQQGWRVGFLTFRNSMTIQFHMNAYSTKREILYAIDLGRNGMGGRTNTYDALRAARTQMFTSTNGDRSGVPNKVVIFTDGGSNMNEQQTQSEARSLRDNGVEIYVGYMKDADMTEINGLATDPDSTHIQEIQQGNANAGARQLASWLCV